MPVSSPAQKVDVKPATTGKASLRSTIVQTAVFLVASVFLLEFLFAIAGLGEQEYLMPNRTWGYDPIPNKSVTWRKEGYARLKMNSMGMQDDERTLIAPAGTKRVAILGDSFIEALQVDRKANVCQQLQQLLNAQPAAASWQVLNFGVSNATLGQIYLRLKNKVLGFKPDVVVVEFPVDATFHLIPDPTGGMLSASPTFVSNGSGDLEEDHQKIEHWYQSSEGKRIRSSGWLRANSRIWGVVSTAVEQAAGWWHEIQSGRSRWGSEIVAKEIAFPTADDKPKTTTVVNPALTNVTPTAPAADLPVGPFGMTQAQLTANESKATRFYWSIADGLFKKIKAECAATGAELVVLRFPLVQKADNPEETRLLRESAKRYGITVIDATPEFLAARGKNQELYYRCHLNPDGHKVLASEIYRQGTVLFK